MVPMLLTLAAWTNTVLATVSWLRWEVVMSCHPHPSLSSFHN